MIKYKVFRNDKFIINVIDIINDNNLSSILKVKIKGRFDLCKDQRYGRGGMKYYYDLSKLK